MTLYAVVPVRGGSKGLPGKNLRPLGGIPLWRRAVEQGQAAGAARVVVSTDIPSLLAQDDEASVSFLARPPDLAGDETPMDPVLDHALRSSVPEGAAVVLLQATSPLRSVEDIRAAIALYQTGAFDLVKTVTPTSSGILKYGMMEGDRFIPVADPAYCFQNRQSLPEVMRPNGAVYVFGRDWFLQNGGLATERMGAVVMPAERSFDIDTEEDFVRAEAMLA